MWSLVLPQDSSREQYGLDCCSAGYSLKSQHEQGDCCWGESSCIMCSPSPSIPATSPSLPSHPHVSHLLYCPSLSPSLPLTFPLSSLSTSPPSLHLYLLLQVLDAAINSLQSAEVSDLPTVIKFINENLTPGNAKDVVMEVREKLGLDFSPTPIISSTPLTLPK